jgi:hypothetical protein
MKTLLPVLLLFMQCTFLNLMALDQQNKIHVDILYGHYCGLFASYIRVTERLILHADTKLTSCNRDSYSYVHVSIEVFVFWEELYE